MVVVDGSRCGMVKQERSTLIYGFKVSYKIGLREFGYYHHSTHDSNITAHDVDSRVFWSY